MPSSSNPAAQGTKTTQDRRADLVVAFGSALVNVVSAQQRYKFREVWQERARLLARSRATRGAAR